MLPSRRMNGRNDQEEQWNRMRSVCTQWCDKFTGVSVIHNGRPQRCAVPPWAWDSGTALRDSAFLSIYLSPICLPVCLCSPSKLRCRSHTNANSGTCYMRASIWTPARNQHSSLCSYPLLAALMYLPPPRLQVTSYLLGRSRCPHNVFPCLEVDTAVSALTRPVIEY